MKKAIDKHWEGHHTKECNVYSVAYLGMVCRYTGQGNFMQSDYLRERFVRFN